MAKMRTISEIRLKSAADQSSNQMSSNQSSLTMSSNQSSLTMSSNQSSLTMSSPQQGIGVSSPSAGPGTLHLVSSLLFHPEMDTEPDPELIDNDYGGEDGSIIAMIQSSRGPTTCNLPTIPSSPHLTSSATLVSMNQQSPIGNCNTVPGSNPLEDVKENLEPSFPLPKIGGGGTVGLRVAPSSPNPSGHNMPQVAPSVAADLLKFVEDPSFGYVDFAKRIPGGGAARRRSSGKQQQQQGQTPSGGVSEQQAPSGQQVAPSGNVEPYYPTLRVQDHSWDDQGYGFVNYFYPEAGSLLDEKFKTAHNMTYFTYVSNFYVNYSSNILIHF